MNSKDFLSVFLASAVMLTLGVAADAQKKNEGPRETVAKPLSAK